jgi:hypothetical protein
MQLKGLKKGEWFTRKSLGEKEAKPSQVYIRGDYDRTIKKYCCGRCDDISFEVALRGDTEIYQDFVF